MYLDNALRYRRQSKYLFNSTAPSMAELRRSDRARVITPINALYGGRIKLTSGAVKRLQKSGSLKSFFKNLGRKIKSGAQKVWGAVKPVATKVWGVAKKVVDVAANNPIVRGIVEKIPVIGPSINKATKIADDVIDRAEMTAKSAKDVSSKIIDSGKRVVDGVKNKDINAVTSELANIGDIKKGMLDVKEKAQELFDAVRPKVSSGTAGAIMDNIKRLNFKRFERPIGTSQTDRMRYARDWAAFKKAAPYAIFANDINAKRLTIPAKLRNELPNAPKSIDNTGGRIFLGAGEETGRCGGISLTDNTSGRIHLGDSGRINLGGKMLDMYKGKSSSDKQSGRIHLGDGGRINLGGKAKKELDNGASLAALKAFLA